MRAQIAVAFATALVLSGCASRPEIVPTSARTDPDAESISVYERWTREKQSEVIANGAVIGSVLGGLVGVLARDGKGSLAGAAVGAAIRQDISKLPWPPPPPSTKYPIENAIFLDGRPSVQLIDVAKRLEAALDETGHGEWGFYALPGREGFALASRLERLKPDGAPAEEDRRFVPPNGQPPFSIKAFIQGLFFEDPGFFRVVVFVVTNRFEQPRGAPLTSSAAIALASAGAPALPERVGEPQFDDSYSVVAMVYEFVKESGAKDENKVQFLDPPRNRIVAKTHLIKANLWQAITGQQGR